MKHTLLVLLLALVLLCAMAFPGYAQQEMPDLSRQGSISLTLSGKDGPVSGGSMKLLKVADAVCTDTGFAFVLTQNFAPTQEELTDLNSALAERLSSFAQENALTGISAPVDQQGRVTFDKQSVGLYLLMQDQPAEDYLPVVPFLVTIPIKDQQTYLYHVDASPKVAPVEPTEPTTPPTDPQIPDEPTLPQTGMLSWPIPVLAVAGLFCLVIGLFLKRKSSHAQ